MSPIQKAKKRIEAELRRGTEQVARAQRRIMLELWEREGRISMSASYIPESDLYCCMVRFGKKYVKELSDVYPSEILCANVVLAIQAGVGGLPKDVELVNVGKWYSENGEIPNRVWDKLLKYNGRAFGAMKVNVK